MSSMRTCHQCGAALRAEDRFCPQCGTAQRDASGAAAPASPASPWEQVLERLRVVTAPRYRVLRMLGHGGMAAVFLAEEPRLGRRVAIKVMAPGLLMDPRMISRFHQEARTTAQLHHPNIVTIFDVDERDGLHYFVMAYVPGRSLARVMAEKREALPIRAVTHWLLQAGGALAYAHRAGVVHRDVKPANILLDAEGNALVTDFGIAKLMDEPGLTRTGVLVGTPAYMSPEQCVSGPVGGASDQYSLGVVAFEMLTGRPPFTGATVAVLHAHVHEQPRPVRELRPDCPEALAAVVERMLAKRPEDRFPDITTALAALGAQPLAPNDPFRAELAALAAPSEADAQAAGAQALTPHGQIEIVTTREPVAPGESVDLQVRVDGQDSGELRQSLVWRTSDPSIAVVTGAGRVQALRPGSVVITASAGQRTVSTRLTVVEPAPAVGLATPPPGAGARTPPAVPAGYGIAVDEGAEAEPVGATALFQSDPSMQAGGVRAGSATPPGAAGPAAPAPGTAGPAGTAAAAPAATRAGAAARQGAAEQGAGGKGGGAGRWWLIGGGVAGAAALAAALLLLPGRAAEEPSAGEDVRQAGVGQAGQVADPGAGEPVAASDAPPDPDTSRVQRPQPDPVAVAPSTAQTPTDAASRSAAAPREAASEPPPPSPRAPAPGRIVIMGDLPPGTEVTVSGEGMAPQRVSGSVSLPPGTYSVEATAPGYAPSRTTIGLGAGESVGWSPTLVPIPAEPQRPADPPAAAQPPAREDTAAAAAAAAAAAEAQVREVIEAFVAAFQSRDVNALTRQYPGARGEWERTWRPFLTNTRDVRNLRARLANVSSLSVSGDSAQATFSMALQYDDFRNERRTPTVNLQATLRRSGDGWVLSDLMQVR